jgi:hypothetical protein
MHYIRTDKNKHMYQRTPSKVMMVNNQQLSVTIDNPRSAERSHAGLFLPNTLAQKAVFS